MRVQIWLIEWVARRRARAPAAAAPAAPFGDFRGSYGFGHRAHRPDPGAKYGFDPIGQSGDGTAPK